VELDSLQNPQKAFVGHSFLEKTLTLELGQESDGFRRFYAHLLALYQKPSKQTLIFEEPENGIYPGALSLLADEFKAAPESGRGQVLLTTHSPALLDHFSADQIRVVELVDLETKIGPLAEDQKESLQEELLHAGELLTVDPARRQE
jgi:predicted ATPase